MKTRKITTLLSLAAVAAFALVSCGAKETTTVLEAEKATLTSDASSGAVTDVSGVTDEGGTYVRLNSAWIPGDPSYKLDFTFTADKAQEATIAYVVAAPIADTTSGNMGTVLSEMYGVKVNGNAVDVSAWDDTLGEPYDVTAEAPTFVTINTTVTLAAGKNDIQFYTIEKSGSYGDYVWHCTDSVCIDKVEVTTKATITVA